MNRIQHFLNGDKNDDNVYEVNMLPIQIDSYFEVITSLMHMYFSISGAFYNYDALVNRETPVSLTE